MLNVLQTDGSDAVFFNPNDLFNGLMPLTFVITSDIGENGDRWIVNSQFLPCFYLWIDLLFEYHRH